jgi:hypothetical protein
MSETNLAHTIVPKSDQLNADDLIAGPMTITVTRVTAAPSSADQPVSVHFEGDDGKPYKPCKSMRRVLVQLWGARGDDYAGRRMTLYRDASVRFGGIEVGGIRISHMSHIDGEKKLALTVTRGKRAPYIVKPLPASQAAGKSAGADVRTADGAQGDRPSPPADDFPGDAPTGHVFQLRNSKGEVRETRDGEQWAAALEGMFAKAASEEVAADVWKNNRSFVTAAEEGGHKLLAQRVWTAAAKRGVVVE